MVESRAGAAQGGPATSKVVTVEDDKLEPNFSIMIDESTQDSIFKCNLCEDTFNTWKSVKSHITRIHNSVPRMSSFEREVEDEILEREVEDKKDNSQVVTEDEWLTISWEDLEREIIKMDLELEQEIIKMDPQEMTSAQIAQLERESEDAINEFYGWYSSGQDERPEAVEAERKRLLDKANAEAERKRLLDEANAEAERKILDKAMAEAEKKKQLDEANAEAERKRLDEAAEAERKRLDEAKAKVEKKRLDEAKAEAERKRLLDEANEAERKRQLDKAMAEAEKKKQLDEAAEAERKRQLDEAKAKVEKKRQLDEAKAEAERKIKLDERKRQLDEAKAEAERKIFKAEAERKRQLYEAKAEAVRNRQLVEAEKMRQLDVKERKKKRKTCQAIRQNKKTFQAIRQNKKTFQVEQRLKMTEQKDLSSGAKAKDERLKPRFRARGKISVRNREKTKERKREIKSFPAEIRQRMKTFRVKLNQRMKYSKERWRMLANQEEEGQARFSKLMVECVIVSGVTDN